MRQNGLALPNQMTLGVQVHPGPHANPISAAIPVNGGLEVHVWGGLTALQAGALQIAAGTMAALEGQTLSEHAIELIATEAVAVAAATLNAANNYRPPTDPAKENSDG